ncbi:hypothetical protein INT43_008528, partial [Umbelopsis isabellina]
METATVVSTAVDPIDLVPYPQQGSSFNFVQSSVRQSSDIRQDTEFARLVERVKSDYENKELESAKSRIAQSPLSFRNTFDIQLWSLKIHIRTSNLDQAVALFINLHAENMQSHLFQQFVLTLAGTIEDRHLDHNILGRLPPLYLRSVLDYAIEHHLERNEKYKAGCLMVAFMKQFSRLEPDYVIVAIDLVYESDVDNDSDAPTTQYRSLLVRDIIPFLFKYRLEIVSGDERQVKTDGKHITALFNKKYYLQLLRVGQSYFANQAEWDNLFQFTTCMLKPCGLEISFAGPVENFIAELTRTRPMEPDNEMPMNRIEYETAAVISKLLQLSMEYYDHICSNDDSNEEKCCLIPICALSPISADPVHRQNASLAETDNHKDSEDLININGKRLRSPRIGSESASSNTSSSDSSELEKPSQPKKQKETSDKYMTKDVEEALFILNCASQCLHHLDELSGKEVRQLTPPTDSSGFDWNIVMSNYELSFVLSNAMLLLRSDLALVNPKSNGNLAMALKLNQELCDRIEVQRSKEKLGTEKESLVHEIPFMFAFRVLYTISIIYLLVGSIPQSTTEVAIILSVFPIARGLSEEDFEIDERECRRAINTFQGREFGMMRMTQQGFVARCIKHLVVGLDTEAEQKGGMASIDSAMRWDEKAGHIMVLMQFGWPYWKQKTPYWNRITQHMKEKRFLKNRTFLEHIHVPDILNTLLWLQENESVTLDIIPTDMNLNGDSLDHNSTSTAPSSPRQPSATMDGIGSPIMSAKHLPSLASLPLLHYNKKPQPPKIYQPPSINTILPSMCMSPTWYSASFQKGADAQWMSPSFYYSRPATSVLLPTRPGVEPRRAQWHQPNTSKDM